MPAGWLTGCYEHSKPNLFLLLIYFCFVTVRRHHCRRINSGNIIQIEKSKLCQENKNCQCVFRTHWLCARCVRAMTRLSYPFIHKCFTRHAMADISNCIFSFFASFFFRLLKLDSTQTFNREEEIWIVLNQSCDTRNRIKG